MSKKTLIKDIVLMTFATFLIAFAVFFFLMPSHAAISSIAGLCIVLANFVPLSVATLSMILNVFLLIVGFSLLGREFGFKTVYTSILLPTFLWLFEALFPNYTSMTGDATLDVVCYIFVVSIGLGILFNDNASSGGLDIVAKIINKFFHVEIGKALSVAGICIALSSALAYDKKTVILSLIGTYLNGVVLDHFIFGLNLKKRVCIIPSREEEMKDFIINTLHSGATIYQAKGAYDGTVRNEIITIVDKQEYQKLMDFIEREDPKAFVTVYTVNEIRYTPKVAAR
ncbi:MAG: YitT family protein [Lachnospiraceae bacterium]|nr:YitT family protein [Lachnospiraceae bacterium]